MKIVHIADTHLGRAGFNKTTEDGSNLRETLIYNNFIASIEKIINLHPDVVIHAGDLFDVVHPKTKAYTTVLTALDLLEESCIPLIAIAGNHSMQKTMYNISPFTVIDHYKNLYPAYSFKYELAEINNTRFHLIPNMLRAEDYHKAYKEIAMDSNYANILVTHGLAATIQDRKLSTVAEFELDENILTDKFDYIALGHYHGQMQVMPNAWYSGSIEYLTYGEIGDVKGGLIFDTDKHTVSHLDLPHIPMVDLGTISCANLTTKEIQDIIIDRMDAKGRMVNSMVQVTLDFENTSMRQLPSDFIDYISEGLLDLKIRIKSKETSQSQIQHQSLNTIDYIKEFGNFIQQQPINDLQKPVIEKCGSETLKTVMMNHLDVTE
jgi:DNA repair exonuclease SbcCD nuclease subunit